MYKSVIKTSYLVVATLMVSYSNSTLSKTIISGEQNMRMDSTLSVLPPPGQAETHQQTVVPNAAESPNSANNNAFPRGQAYINLCRNKGVPIPPDFGSNSWNNIGSRKWQAHGTLDTKFIQKNRAADVYSYKSNSPEGMCYALPRYNEKDEAFIFAVICHGRQSSNACFWDIDHDAPKPKRGQSVKILDLLTPADLEEKCTSCHAGQTPYIIHPNTLLDQPGRDTNHWYTPVVPLSWPQNPGPANSPTVCEGCHNTNGIAGALPAISSELENYCEFVLKPALSRTMPPGAPGSLNDNTEVQALLDRCTMPRTAAYVSRHISSNSAFNVGSTPVELQDFNSEQRWLTGDFNGDGLQDLAYVYGEPQNDGTLKAKIATYLDGFAREPKIAQFAGFGSNQRWLVGDFNGDGRDDLVNVYGKNNDNRGQTARAWVHLSTGSSFEYNSSFTIFAGFWNSQRWMTGDFNGDGKDDLVNVYGKDNPAGGQTARAWVHLSTGKGFEYNSSFTVFSGYGENQRWLTGDFNGDGLDDLVNVYGKQNPAGSQTGRAWLHLSTGDGFEYNSKFTVLAKFANYQRWLSGDYNNDGISDLVNMHAIKPRYDEPLRTRSWVHLSDGNGGFEYQSSLTLFRDEFANEQHWLVGDFNSDGTDDLVKVFGKNRHE